MQYTFDQFIVQLTEWVEGRCIHRYFSEVLALYSAGYPATQVGPLLREKIKAHH